MDTGQLRSVGTAFLARRPLIVAPMMAAALGVAAWAGAPGRQLGALATGMTAILAFFAWEAHRARRGLAVSVRGLFISLVLTQLGIGFALAATGGLASPLLPMLFAPTGVGFAAFGRALPSRALAMALFAVLAALAGLPVGTPFPPLPDAAYKPLLLLAMLTSVVLLELGVGSLSDAYTGANAATVRARSAALDEAEARTRAVEAMGAKVAHEIRNPLSSVKGLVELLAEDETRERAAKRLAVVGSEIARIEAILSEYLSFARPLTALHPVALDVGATCREVVEVVEVRAARAGVRLDVLDAHGAVIVEADPHRLKEAVFNLLANALDASAPGSSISVGWRATDDGGAAITVTDRGRGMSSETLARVGTAFFTTRDGGTGLGVALARQAAKQHGGALTYDSAPGRGTSVTLTLAKTPPADT